MPSDTENTQVPCYSCGGATNDVDVWDFVGYTVCGDCYTDAIVCACCDRPSFGGEYHYSQDGDICLTCSANYYHECDECGDRVNSDNECNNCVRSEDEYAHIHNYSFKPDPIFYTGDGERPTVRPAYMGIEVEFEMANRDYGSRSLYDATVAARSRDLSERRFYFKNDGSLNYGAEYVTHPATLAAWQGAMGDDLCGDLHALSVNGARAWTRSNCGLHIHVSRDAFNDLRHIASFALLFALNEVEATTFAGRTSHYASFSDLRSGGIVSKVTGRGYANHSDAVNLSGDHTVEVRIFRPSLAGARVVAAIELVDAVRVYTENLKQVDVNGGGLAWDRFAAWVAEHPNYRRAAAVMAESGRSSRFTVAPTLEASSVLTNPSEAE